MNGLDSFNMPNLKIVLYNTLKNSGNPHGYRQFTL